MREGGKKEDVHADEARTLQERQAVRQMERRERAPREGGDTNDVRERSGEHLQERRKEERKREGGMVGVGREGGRRNEHQK